MDLFRVPGCQKATTDGNSGVAGEEVESLFSAKLTLRLRRGHGWIFWKGNCVHSLQETGWRCNPKPKGQAWPGRRLQAWLGCHGLGDVLTSPLYPMRGSEPGILRAGCKAQKAEAILSVWRKLPDLGVGSAPMVTMGGGGRRGWVKVRATDQDQCRRAPEVDGQLSTGPPYLRGKPDQPSWHQACYRKMESLL